MTVRIPAGEYDYTGEERRGVNEAQERARLAAQLEAMRRPVDEYARLRERRAGRADHVALVNLAPGVWTADGEVLVRGAAADTPVPEGFGPRPSRRLRSRRDAFSGQLRRLRADTPDVRTLRKALRATNDEGQQSAPNHVCLLAPVTKGDGSPENTAIRRRFPVDLERRLGRTGRVQVAIIDTGLTAARRRDRWLDDVPVDATNADLLDVLSPPRLLDLGAGHGTFVAGIVQQVCPTARIRVYKALDTDGVGKEDAIAAQMVQAVLDGAQVLSLSLGTQTVDDVPPVAFRTVLDWIASEHPEVLVVAAAGNYENRRPVWPAAFKQVVAVGGLAADLSPAPWSSRGHWVDCSAVGEGIISTYVKGTELPELGGSVFGANSWAMWTGTSFTAPQIAGAVARTMQENRTEKLSPRKALSVLLEGASWVPDHGAAVRLLPGTLRP